MGALRVRSAGWAIAIGTLAIAPPLAGQATVSWGALQGRIVDGAGLGVAGAVVSVEGAELAAASDQSGAFVIPRIAPGTYVLQIIATGYAPASAEAFIRPGSTTSFDVALENFFLLDEVAGTARALPGTTAHAPEILNGLVLAGTSNTVIRLQGVAANLAEKTPRQLFARVPGVFTYDMDGSGNQVNVSTRGLDPHRSWELNVRARTASS
jgi:Fe(3+) dicitrate transport protein